MAKEIEEIKVEISVVTGGIRIKGCDFVAGVEDGKVGQVELKALGLRKTLLLHLLDMDKIKIGVDFPTLEEKTTLQKYLAKCTGELFS